MQAVTADTINLRNKQKIFNSKYIFQENSSKTEGEEKRITDTRRKSR